MGFKATDASLQYSVGATNPKFMSKKIGYMHDHVTKSHSKIRNKNADDKLTSF